MGQSKSNFIWSFYEMGGRKVCSKGPGHMTKMATMLIYGRHLKNLLLWNQKADDLETWYALSGALSTTKFAQMMTLGWPWYILRPGQIWSLVLLYGKKVKQCVFQKLLYSIMSKLVDAVNWISTWIYMNIKGHGHSLTLVQCHSDSHFQTSFH